MATETIIEERLSAVEAAVAELQQLLPPAQNARNWLEQITGSMKEEPAFEEVLALGRAFREADRPPGELEP